MQPQQKSFASISVQSAKQPPRRWYRPQFSLLTILLIISLAALILGVNLWPPKITGEYYNVFGGEFREDTYHFRAQRGWPFKHLDASSEQCHERDATPVDAGGWPLGKPAPPRVTNWYKLIANILVLSAIAASLCWIIKWAWEMCGAIKRLPDGASRGGVRYELILTPTLCLVGTIAIAWGIVMTRHTTFDVADFLLTWGFVQHIPGWALKRLLLPPLFIAAGLVSLVAARRWLQPHAGKLRLTAMTIFALVLLVVIDGLGRSLADRFVFDMMRSP